MAFSSFHLSPPLLRAIADAAFTVPTPIQTQVIPLVLEKKDILARAQTGSGKTASFVLPILELFTQTRGEGKAKIKALILTPTRELTLQVAQAFQNFSTHYARPLSIVSIIGGERIGEQLYDIQQGCDILVATAGRLIDVLSKKQMDLSKLEFFVLDEADRMLDLGFAEELDLILDALPKKRQNLLFSATYPEKMRLIARKITHNPIEITIQEEKTTVERIHQRAILVNRENRGPLLRHLLQENPWKQVLVFMANKRASDNIAAKFRKYGIEAESFHGNLTQDDRTLTLNDFKAKKIHVLFSTDLAARGLDIDTMPCVINFDLPRSPSDYIHRIGRTGRAGESGEAISFLTLEDDEHFKLIEKRADISLAREQIAGFEREGEVVQKPKGQAPIKGKRKSKKDKLREAAAKK